MSQVHPRARTTPRTRAEIKASPATLTALAERYNITVSTARKWKLREDPQDRSHRPHKLSTTLTPAQEVLAVELRRTLLLSLDDLLAVVREFINAAVSRSGLDRCLRRHGVSDLKSLQPRLPVVPDESVYAVEKSGPAITISKKNCRCSGGAIYRPPKQARRSRCVTQLNDRLPTPRFASRMTPTGRLPANTTDR